MRSVEHRFKKIEKGNPGLSSFQHFLKTVRSQNYSLQTISRKFNELVEKDDYDSTIKRALLFQLYVETKLAEDNKKQD